MIFTMAEPYVSEDKVGIPYVYSCQAGPDDKNSECYEARFERELKDDKPYAGIRVKKYLIGNA